MGKKSNDKNTRPMMPRRAAQFVLDKVLRDFRESSLYEDYRDCPDEGAGFTDEEYEVAVQALELFARGKAHT
ncbi:MAG: hypothetical protein NTW87_11250 [Planctomycetota bacterium]|nr:hypothetical protein [Planctomycetota bacterium]